ncbi:hypothetical protein FOMPIDRAFT_93308, partial [Fomitopsis schrenkii]
MSDYYQSSEAGSQRSSPSPDTYTRLSPATTDYFEADRASDFDPSVQPPEPSEFYGSECGTDGLSDGLANDGDSDANEPTAGVFATHEESYPTSSSGHPSVLSAPGPNDVESTTPNRAVDSRSTREDSGTTTPPLTDKSRKEIDASVGSTPV